MTSARDPGRASVAMIESNAEVGKLVARLCEVNKTIAIAESCTGGLVASAIAATDGAGECFVGGVVAYAAHVKYDVLGVAAGAPVINAAAAKEMADGVRRLLGADVGLATTGVVGPDAQEDQPVGTIWIGVSSGDDRASAHRVDVDGDPDRVRAHAMHYALAVAVAHLS
jgi:PncC family amidohydrolase